MKSPTQFRTLYSNDLSKIRQIKSKNSKAGKGVELYVYNISHLLKFINMNANIEIKKTPVYKIAAVTHMGVQGLEHAFQKVIKCARSVGFWSEDESKMVRVFHDSFKVTSPDKVRMTVGTIVNENVRELDELSLYSIDDSKCIVGNFSISPNQFEQAWNSMYIWMTEKGFRPTEQKPFEIYHNDFRKHSENKMIVDLHIPIK